MHELIPYLIIRHVWEAERYNLHELVHEIYFPLPPSLSHFHPKYIPEYPELHVQVKPFAPFGTHVPWTQGLLEQAVLSDTSVNWQPFGPIPLPT